MHHFGAFGSHYKGKLLFEAESLSRTRLTGSHPFAGRDGKHLPSCCLRKLSVTASVLWVIRSNRDSHRYLLWLILSWGRIYFWFQTDYTWNIRNTERHHWALVLGFILLFFNVFGRHPTNIYITKFSTRFSIPIFMNDELAFHIQVKSNYNINTSVYLKTEKWDTTNNIKNQWLTDWGVSTAKPEYRKHIRLSISIYLKIHLRDRPLKSLGLKIKSVICRQPLLNPICSSWFTLHVNSWNFSLLVE